MTRGGTVVRTWSVIRGRTAEAGIPRAAGVGTAEHQRACNHERERQCDLDHHETGAEALTAATLTEVLGGLQEMFAE